MYDTAPPPTTTTSPPPKPITPPPKPISKAPNKPLPPTSPPPLPPRENSSSNLNSHINSSSPKSQSSLNLNKPPPAIPPRETQSSLNLNKSLPPTPSSPNTSSTTTNNINNMTEQQIKRSTMPALPPRNPNKNKPLPTPNVVPISPDIHPLSNNNTSNTNNDHNNNSNGNNDIVLPPPPNPTSFSSIRKPVPSQQYNTVSGIAAMNSKNNNSSNSSNSSNNNNNPNINYGPNEIIVEQIPNPISVSNHPSLDHLSEFTTMRDMKCKEILTTERTYVDNMKILVEVYIKPLKEGEGGISKELASVICGNIPDILLISIELLGRLEEKLANWSNKQTIGDTFSLLTPFLKMYTNYTVGFDNVLSIVTDLEKNSTFTAFIQKCTEDPKTKKLDLRSYLIQPVQRITRYHMLLEEVVKHTDPTHLDYPLLVSSYNTMKKVTNDANEAIKMSENRQKVFNIQNMFVTDPGIVAPHREFLFEGTLTKVCRKACKKRVVFLFSDLLVYGSSIPPKLLLHEKIELDHCRIEDIPDGNLGGSSSISLNGTVINNAFQICSNKKSFVVFADNAELKMKWMIVLIEAIDKLKEKRKTIKKEKIDHAEAPVWVPDETTTNCTQCNDTFSFVNRRHHCRMCGALVCGKCSENKLKLPITDYKPARVCNQCHASILDEKMAQTKI